MNTGQPTATVTISVAELDTFIRRAVREAVHDELTRLLSADPTAVIDDWDQEGPEDEEGDLALLAEALHVLQERKKNKAGWKSWETYKAELQ